MHNSDTLRCPPIETVEQSVNHLKRIENLADNEWAFDDTSAKQSRQYRLAAWHLKQAIGLIESTKQEQEVEYERIFGHNQQQPH